MADLNTDPNLEERLRATLGRHLSPPITFPLAAALAFDHLGLPIRKRNVPDG